MHFLLMNQEIYQRILKKAGSRRERVTPDHSIQIIRHVTLNPVTVIGVPACTVSVSLHAFYIKNIQLIFFLFS